MKVSTLFAAAWWRLRAGAIARKLREEQARLRHLQALEDDNFLRLLGIITQQWAVVEITLDLSNFDAIHTPEGGSLAKELPRSLNPKIELFKKIHRRVPALAHLNEEGQALAARVVALREKRHDLIHGLVSALDAPNTRPRRVQRVVLDGRLIDYIERDYTMDDIMELCGEVSGLVADLQDHQAAITELLSPDEPQDALG